MDDLARGAYPSFVIDDADRERWDLCKGTAQRVTGRDYGAEVEMFARSLNRSDVPTHDPEQAREARGGGDVGETGPRLGPASDC